VLAIVVVLREQQSLVIILMLLHLPLPVQVIRHMDYHNIIILILILIPIIILIQLLSQGTSLLKADIIMEVAISIVLKVWMLVIVVHLAAQVRYTMTVVVLTNMGILVPFLLIHHHGVLRVLVPPTRVTNKVILELVIRIWQLEWLIILQLCETIRKIAVIEPPLLQDLVDYMHATLTCTVHLPIFNHHLNSLRHTIII